MATKTLVDYMTEEDYARYNALISLAEEAKANAPKAERKPRAPQTIEQKKKAAEARLAKAQAALEELLASQAN